VVDYDYRGNVGVILFNHAETDFQGARPRALARALPGLWRLAASNRGPGTRRPTALQ